MDPKLKPLARVVANSQKEALASFDLERQRTRFLLHALARPRRKGYAATAAAFVIAAIAVAIYWRANTPLQFHVAGAPGRSGERITAPASSALPLAFSDGSQLLLSARTDVRVRERSAHGAHIVLERGSLEARITHRAHTRWRVDAGPFQVHVVGTAFEVSWRDQRLLLRLREGAVRVVGPQLGAPRSVVAGERLEVDLGASAASARPVADATPPVATPSPALSVPEPAAPARSNPSWRKLAATGAHDQAFQLLLQQGFEPLLRTGSAADLALAADLARFADYDEEARVALLALRARFAGSILGSDAAFGLGRLAFDRRNALTEAARWFEVYMAEAPDGALRREAAGRLIECYLRLHDAERTQRAARRYLAAFPAGPHAGLARSSLGAADADVP